MLRNLTNMFSHEENISDTHVDNNEISRSNVNYLPFIKKLSSLEAVKMEKKLQFVLRKCKSESSFEESPQIEIMGLTLSRSKSHENIQSENVLEPLVAQPSVSQPLLKTEAVLICSSSDEEYELLESSDSEDHPEHISFCNNESSEGYSKTKLIEKSCDRQECSQEEPCELPTTSSHQIENINQDQCSKCSLPIKISNNENDERPFDKIFFSNEVKSATLPKRRSRFGDSQFRQSLGKAFRSQLKNQPTIEKTSENLTVVTPETNGQIVNSGESKNFKISFSI